MNRTRGAALAFLMAAASMLIAVVYRWGPCLAARATGDPGAACFRGEDDSFDAAATLGGPHMTWAIGSWGAYLLISVAILLLGAASRRMVTAALVVLGGFSIVVVGASTETWVAFVVAIGSAVAPVLAGRLVWPLTHPGRPLPAIACAFAIAACMPVWDFVLSVPLNGGYSSHDTPQLFGGPAVIGAVVAALIAWRLPDAAASESAAIEHQLVGQR